ncbi:MAG TPA: DUF6194 family protein [Candidatus Thermoplasmatota archaeon]|nr:DUF6194 family protein [Candidatus Thermoplasmatota archaeon]
MDPERILQHLRSLEGVEILSTEDTHYIFYDPEHDTPHDKRHPIVTIVTSDAHDQASALHRPGVYRLNMGVGRQRYRALFGPEPSWGKDGGPVDTGHDFTLLDTLLPHPIYAPLSWICILSPSEASWDRVKGLIAEAHAEGKRTYVRHRRG